MKLEPLYSVKLIEANRQHYYQIGDEEEWRPGVTTVLKVLDKPALVPWAAKQVSDNIKGALYERSGKTGVINIEKEDVEAICEEGKNIYKKTSQQAADIGTRVHRAVDNIVRGNVTQDEEEDIKDGVQGFRDWMASHSLKIELGDTKIASKLFGYGGSLDFVAFEGSEAIIFDLKTTKKRKNRPHGIYDEYAYQLAAYRQAFKETFGIPVKAVYALWVNKEKPEFKAVKIANPDICFEGFLACLKMHQISKLEKFEDLELVAR